MYTTLNKIREHDPCTDGWKKLLKYLGKTKPDDEPLSLLTILDASDFEYTLQCFLAVDGFKKEKLLMGVTFAREVEHLMPAESKKSLDVFERYANGLATQKEFDDDAAAARAAAARAADASCAASDAAAARAADVRAAARAADAAAAWAAACAAATAARAASDAAAAWAADATSSAAAAAWAGDAAAAYSTIRTKQESQLRQLLEETK